MYFYVKLVAPFSLSSLSESKNNKIKASIPK